jgi:hypothetical protein
LAGAFEAATLVALCALDPGAVAAAAVLVLTAIAGPALVLAGVLEPDLVVTTMVEAAGVVKPDAGCALCSVTVFAGAEAAFCAAGTLPAPGVPMPGNTVPSCRLPSFGCVAEGVVDVAEAAVCVVAEGCFSGKLIGGNLGGTGIVACAVLDVSGTGTGSGLRWNAPIRGAEAAGTGPLRRAAAVSVPCTRNVIVFPSALSV